VNNEPSRRRSRPRNIALRHPGLTDPGGEQAGLALIYAVTVEVAKRWHGIKVTPADLEKLNALRAEVAPLKATD
jgi:hypothetical protein